MVFPEDIKYHPEHMWVRIDDDGSAVVGITDFAQDQLGKVTYIDLPDQGDDVAAGEEMGAVESAKSVSDLISPVSGEVVEINEALLDDAAALNDDPYGQGWVLKVKLDDEAQLGDLLSTEAYQEAIA